MFLSANCKNQDGTPMRRRYHICTCLGLLLVLPLTTITTKAVAEDLSTYGLFLKSAPRPADCSAAVTSLPLTLNRGDRICLIGNTLFERAQLFGQVPAMIQAGFPKHELS
jgi:hypothetical protein